MARAFVRSILTSWTVAVVTGACSDSIGPDDFAGTYQLVRFEGMQLPAIVSQS